MREHAAKRLVEAVENKVDAQEFHEEATLMKQSLLRIAKSYFSNENDVWPLHYSVFYLGHVPDITSIITANLFSTLAKRDKFLRDIHGEFHLAGIRLAGRIFGEYKREDRKADELRKSRG
jgi:hypothetical protein